MTEHALAAPKSTRVALFQAILGPKKHWGKKAREFRHVTLPPSILGASLQSDPGTSATRKCQDMGNRETQKGVESWAKETPFLL